MRYLLIALLFIGCNKDKATEITKIGDGTISIMSNGKMNYNAFMANQATMKYNFQEGVDYEVWAFGGTLRIDGKEAQHFNIRK